MQYNPPATGNQQPATTLAIDMRTLLVAYRRRIRRQRRWQYFSVVALLIAILWFGVALAHYFAFASTWTLPVAIGATVALPLLVLLLELLRKPSLSETAAIVDRRLDDRQRLVTSVELLSRRNSDALDGVQLHSTDRYLSKQSPKVVYPVRVPTALLSWAAGLALLSVGLYVLKGAGSGFVPIQVGTLPPDQPVASVFATPTPLSGLPPSEITPSPEATPTSQPEELALDSQQPELGDPAAPQSTDSTGAPIEGDPNDPQAQAERSQEAQESLDRLGQALDGESATQVAGDSLRQGDAPNAAEELRKLAEENDQLSDEAKRGLAEALERAADETQGNRALRQAENEAAEALRNGDYQEIKESLERLAQAMEQTAADVIPQDELAEAFPSPTAAAQGTEQGDATEPQDGSGGEQAGEGSEGSGTELGGGESASPGSGEQPPGQGGAQTDGGDGQSQSGAPGQGTRVNGPRDGTDLDTAGNPFEIEGSPDPNANQPGGENPPGLELDGGAGGTGAALPASPGGASDTPGESTNLPLERWDIIRRFFSHER